ncbi:MAG: hypothetical protein A2057_00585 [Ignavibacteria bacterium GWA2_35_9]|nr:MAG: hypothetical protein A2057_00585 [Ignavibacteria bacterium GWA2_35_9]OGU48285.1 MAG: hypothetical protein A2000_02230 [Ignavibacteria bacterium GWB2_36_8]
MNDETKNDMTLEIYNHIQKEEQHFNELEKGYRLLASQWLFASLAAIGFLLQSEKIILTDNYRSYFNKTNKPKRHIMAFR